MRPLVGTRSYAPFEALIDSLNKGERKLAAAGLGGGSTPLILAEVLRFQQTPALVLVDNRKAGLALLADLAFFLRANDGSECERLHYYPPFDVAPFESISPHAAISAQRTACLNALISEQNPIIIAPVEAVMNKIMPRRTFSSNRQLIDVGDMIDRDLLLAELMDIGYHLTSLVEEPGEVAVRGSIIDLFPPEVSDPIRIELFGDEVESIRSFDASRQVSRAHLRQLVFYPSSDVHLSEKNTDRFAQRIKELAEQQDVPKPRRDRLVEEISHRIPFPGIEFFTPLLHETLDTLFDYLSPKSLIAVAQPVETESALNAFDEKIEARHQRARDAGKLCVRQEELYLSTQSLFDEMDRFQQLHVGHEANPEDARHFLFETEIHHGLHETIIARAADANMLSPLVDEIRRWQRREGRVLLVCRNLGAADRLERLLQHYDLQIHIETGTSFRTALSGGQGLTRVPILIGDLSAGFVLPGLELTVITEEEIFGERKRAETYHRRKAEMISSFSDLEAGGFIVHNQHGLGIYRGLVQLEFGDILNEFLHLEYAGGDRLYLPVDRLNSIQRFVGAGAAPKIDRLGGLAWEKAKRTARGAARKLAKELLALYAARANQAGYSFAPPDDMYEEFTATFPYEETADQELAIKDVIADLTANAPADRLICGDVGFGKTEVAMRAAFLAVNGGRQAAVLVPTTTLAFQHYRTFRERMDHFGINVEMLSRFVSAQKRRQTAQKLKEGKVDIAVGTHMLLGKAVKFADLGLLIVDEEQHFGVAQKEKIKQLAKDIDVLTFTATPIPRTLHMSLAGIRDLSVINTPPEDRLAIRTFITRFDDDTIREALERELARGGQAFFIHNRVKTIDSVAARVRRLVPHARIAVGHGQMDEKRLEKLMIDFSQHQFDILVSTTIVESGLDFPLANTIIIDRADALGLSQLYQLRGRVGRSKRRAYCYLLVPPKGAITSDARKRLAVLRTFTDLGSGYKIAARDLEIRGAGNLLGPEQSGHISAVGFEMYTRLLEEEINRLKGEQVEEPFECEVAIGVPAYLPETYVADVHMRLNLYKRIADAADEEEIQWLREELVDRFGRPPASVTNLLQIINLRRRAKELRIKKIEAGTGKIAFELDASTPVTPQRVVELVSAHPGRFSLSPDGKLYETYPGQSAEDLFSALNEGLKRLADYVR